MTGPRKQLHLLFLVSGGIWLVTVVLCTTSWIKTQHAARKKVESLIAKLESPDDAHRLNWEPWARVHVIRELGETRDRRAVPPLIRELSSPSYQVQCEAARALGNLGDTRAVGPLIDTLEQLNTFLAEKDDSSLPVVPSQARTEMLVALEKITWKDFGLDGKKWRHWWEQSQGRKRGSPDTSLSEPEPPSNVKEAPTVRWVEPVPDEDLDGLDYVEVQ